MEEEEEEATVVGTQTGPASSDEESQPASPGNNPNRRATSLQSVNEFWLTQSQTEKHSHNPLMHSA